MKLRIKLSFMMIAIMAIVVTGIAIILLQRSSDISMRLSLRGMEYLANQQIEYWHGKENEYLTVLRTLSEVMGDYEHIPAAERRDRFDDMLLSTVTAQRDMINLYTIWKPNVLDGMDARFVNRRGSTPQGQYAITFTGESGQILSRVTATAEIEAVTAFISNPLNKEKDRVEHPIQRTINGKDTYLLRMMVPIVNPRTQEMVGGVGCLLDIAVIQESVQEIISSHKEVAALTIFSGNGFIMGHLSPQRVGKMLIDVETIFGSYIEEANQAVHEGKELHRRSYSPLLNSDVEIMMRPIQIGRSDNHWSIMIVSALSNILKDVHELTIFTIILGIVSIMLVALVIYFVLGRVTKPIVSVADTLKDIAEGEGDLTHTIIVHSKDEVGDLAKYFNETLEKIKLLVINIKNEGHALSGIGDDLASNMNQTASAIMQITANIKSLKERMINQSASVTETNATMEQITTNINKLNDHVERQTASVAQSSSAIEEMLANIQSVTGTLIRNTENVKSLTSASDVGRSGLQKVATDIQEIAKESEGLLEINSVMQNIASQTNLLSMNAAIEAAHAGETGKGFAVVADEIRKLAENSSKQSKNISVVLKKIKSSIDQIIISTNTVLKEFEAIDTGVRTVADQEENIRHAMEEQGEGSKQILEAISQVNEITQQVKGGSTEMLEGSKEIIREAGNLEKATQEMTGGINEMATGTEQINTAIHRVNELSVKNKENISMLMKEVSRFKT
jgi:methyl-accepting chemotaxis protein